MTNAVVWYDHDSSSVWAVADSLLTAISKNGDHKSVSRVTDQAMKVLRLKVGAWGVTENSIAGGPMLGYEVGMVYAGAVTPALMTYSAAAMMLDNLHPQTKENSQIRTPDLSAVADLIRHLSERYTKDASVGYAAGRAPFCEFVIFGIAPDDMLNCRPLECYWIHPEFNQNKEFSQVAQPIDLLKGEVAVIGDDTESLRAEIKSLQDDPGVEEKGKEPRIALEARMRARKHDTVGGTLQFGVMSTRWGRLDLYGAMHDQYGDPAQNWLGFDFQTEINSILGMPVKIPSLD
ncbi:hypothetical protein [Pseudomonas sp. B35(2017)]|uniref:hypothetical protein n=1 Tax=Pseudomonas sp. B35(2017) TaxID=1981722 RepID=UPI00111C46A9|nr:hypothetical protein [Pseudomonas sp. B35(2017)]